jgi:1,4-dihydroxy-2-naphthoate octaprenyltransferase
LANDYGDTENGADSAGRVGPARAVQSGAITSSAMKRAIIVFALLALASGLVLIFTALSNANPLYLGGFLLLGLGAIAAAIKYTAGSNPYGYKGLGDIFVLVFFGWVGVMGSYFLYAHVYNPLILFPATTMGLFSAGVLNMNNMRDHVSDQQAGKITMVVRMGYTNAKIYQTLLISIAFVCAIIYTLMQYHSPWQFLFLLTLPLFAKHIVTVLKNHEPQLLDKQLKIVALSTLLFCLLFGAGLLLS